MPEPHTPPAHEPGPQPDPMLKPGPRPPAWAWLVALAILVVVVGTLYGLNNREPQTAANQPSPPQTGGESGTPSTAMPGGRTTGSAPAERPADVQENRGGSATQSAPQPQGGDRTGPGNPGDRQ